MPDPISATSALAMDDLRLVIDRRFQEFEQAAPGSDLGAWHRYCAAVKAWQERCDALERATFGVTAASVEENGAIA